MDAANNSWSALVSQVDPISVASRSFSISRHVDETLLTRLIVTVRFHRTCDSVARFFVFGRRDSAERSACRAQRDSLPDRPSEPALTPARAMCGHLANHPRSGVTMAACFGFSRSLLCQLTAVEFSIALQPPRENLTLTLLMATAAFAHFCPNSADAPHSELAHLAKGSAWVGSQVVPGPTHRHSRPGMKKQWREREVSECWLPLGRRVYRRPGWSSHQAASFSLDASGAGGRQGQNLHSRTTTSHHLFRSTPNNSTSADTCPVALQTHAKRSSTVRSPLEVHKASTPSSP